MKYHNQSHLAIILEPNFNKILVYIIMGFTKFTKLFSSFSSTRRRKHKTRRQPKYRRTKRRRMRGG
jgi:hypothetical protein